VIVEADDPSALARYVYSSVRIIVDVASTGGEVLTVPIAAVTLGPDGDSRIEIERAPITDRDLGSTEFVSVEVGLSASGMVQISSATGAPPIEVGDRVVLGLDSGSRLNRDDSSSGASSDSVASSAQG